MTRSSHPTTTPRRERAASPPPQLSLTERAYAEIKQRIITLGYRPGQFLNESTICGQLAIGRTPVHEALHRLKLEGLVEIIPRKGILVRPDSLNDVIALLDARLVVEAHSIGLAAERASAAVLAKLSDLLRRSQRTIASGSMAEFMALDVQFHGERAGVRQSGARRADAAPA